MELRYQQEEEEQQQEQSQKERKPQESETLGKGGIHQHSGAYELRLETTSMARLVAQRGMLFAEMETASENIEQP